MASAVEFPSGAAAPGESTALRLKRRLAESRAALRQAYLDDHSATRLLRDHRALVDHTLKSVWQHVAMPGTATLVAVGGYGRGQLFPYSDIDLLLLLPEAAGNESTATLEQFVSLLWDIGLDVGHSVRT